MNIMDSLKRRVGMWATGYDAAVSTRLRRDLPVGRRTNYDEDTYVGLTDRNILIQKCYDLRRNDGLVQAVVNRFSDNVVGTGITPQAKTTDEDWNNTAEAWWREWSKIADSRGRSNLAQIQKMVVQTRLLAGDMAFIITASGQIQPIESQRIMTPDSQRKNGNIVNGVKIDAKTGRFVGFYVFQRDENGRLDASKDIWEYVRAEDMIFVSSPLRFDQVRGIPELAPILTDVQDMREINAATLQKSKIDAMRAWAIYSDAGNSFGNLGARGIDNGAGATQFEKFEDGQTYYLKPGEKAESLGSNTPGNMYLPYMEYNLRKCGSALGIPYELILMDWSKGSYSSSRAGLLQTFKTFDSWSTWIDSEFHVRLWNWRIAKAIKAGELPPAPLDERGVSQWYKVEWQHPEYGWTDPQSESAANKMDYQMGVTSLSAIVRKKGTDVADVFRLKGSEIGLAQTVADEQMKANPNLSLTWRDIINVETVANQKAGANAMPAEPKEVEPDKDEEEVEVTK